MGNEVTTFGFNVPVGPVKRATRTSRAEISSPIEGIKRRSGIGKYFKIDD
jgi:hypothetical protein